MKDQHTLIKGYRDLSAEEIALMNEIKEHAEKTRHLIAKIEADPDIDMRWLAIGRTDLQIGFMALTRAIAKPTTF